MSILRSIGFKIGEAQARAPKVFLIGALLLTLVLLPGIPILFSHIEPSLEKVLPQDIAEVQLMQTMRSQYGADMLVIVARSQTTVLEPKAQQYLDELATRVRSQDYVLSVDALSDLARSTNNGELLPTQEAYEELVYADARSNQFVSSQRDLALLHVRTDTGANAHAVSEVLAAIQGDIADLESTNPGLSIRVSGFNAIDNDTFQIIRSDFIKITGLSFALMVIVLLLYYRGSLKKTLYSLAIMMFALIWTLGLCGYLGLPLNVVTMVAAAMIMALGSSYGINSVYHFYDDFLLQYPLKKAIAHFQEFLIVGLTGSALAEIAAFLALLFGLMPSMHALGIMLAIGIACALLASVLVLPVLFYLWEQSP